MAWVGIPSLKPCTRLYARLPNPASLNVSGPAADAPRPPALVVDPNLCSQSAQALSLAPIVSNGGLSGLALHKENAISKRSAKRIANTERQSAVLQNTERQ